MTLTELLEQLYLTEAQKDRVRGVLYQELDERRLDDPWFSMDDFDYEDVRNALASLGYLS